ncbi:MAG: PTS sugar transporter subunit IIA [Cellvibrionaceae bacterium]
MNISNILSPSRSICRANGGSKKRVLEETAKVIADDYPAMSADELFRELINRERLGSTGIGQGIAIPHCRVSNCPRAVGVLLTLSDPVDFESVDDKPVDIVFALLVPDEAHEQHLQTLASLAQAFSNEENLNSLRDSETNEELFQTASMLFDNI